MIELEKYLKNPCGTLSIPYWKAESMTIPDSIKVIHARDSDGNVLTEEQVEYFKDSKALNDPPKMVHRST